MPNSRENIYKILFCAAGDGKRMGGVEKPLYPILGKPLLYYTLTSLAQTRIDFDILIACKVSQQDAYHSIARAICSAHSLQWAISIIGLTDDQRTTRQQTVYHGFKALLDQAIDPQTYCIVCDATRPFFLQNDWASYLQSLKQTHALICIKPISETLIEKTPTDWQQANRQNFFTTTTPQGFSIGYAKQILDLYARETQSFTDEASALIALDLPFEIYPSPSYNIKLTYREDLPIFEALIQRFFLC